MTKPFARGRRRRFMTAGVLFASAASLWAISFTTHRFSVRDAYDYAQLGRQIAKGRGFTTAQTFPRHISYMSRHDSLEREWPSFLRYPATPTLNALFQTVIDDPVTAAVAQVGLWFLLSVPVFFLLAARLTDDWLALAATILYVGDPRVWRDAFNGMTESLGIFLVIATFAVALSRGVRRGHFRSWSALGLLCGLAYLSRSQLVVLIPLGLLLAAAGVPSGARIRSSFAFLMCASLIVSPWLLRNYGLTGNPGFSFGNSRNLMAHTATHAGFDRYLHEPTSVAQTLELYGGEILDKILLQLWPNAIAPAFWMDALGVYAIGFPLALIGLALSYRSRAHPTFRRFELGTALLFIINFLVVSLIYHRQRYYDILIPLLIIVLAYRIARLAAGLWPGRRPLAHRVVVVILVGCGLMRLTVTLREHGSLPGPSSVDVRSYETLRALVGPKRVVLSDLSAEVTLYNGNRSIRAPAIPDEVLEIDSDYLRVDNVLLSQRLVRQYGQLLAREDFKKRYRLVARLPNAALLFERITGLQAMRGAVPPAQPPTGPRYYAAQLHLHGSFSEGLGTMRGHNMAARDVGIDVLWWTDHDWRIARHTHFSTFGFEAMAAERFVPNRKIPWKKTSPKRGIPYGLHFQKAGEPLRHRVARLTDTASTEGLRSLELAAAAVPANPRWGWSMAQLFANGSRFGAPLAADVSLRLSVQAMDLGPDAQAVIRVNLSRQPRGISELWYVLGDDGTRRVEVTADRVLGIVPMHTLDSAWSALSLPITADAIELGLGGWDNHLTGITLAARARLGATARVLYDGLQIETATEPKSVLSREVAMAREFEQEFDVKNNVGLEVSYSQHMNAYLPQIELPDFRVFPSGMSGRQIVEWVHERGGVVSYNHIFGAGFSLEPGAKESSIRQFTQLVIGARAYGADLLEVGYPLRVEPLRKHLAVWDELSADGVFLTGIGSSDSHDHVNGWFDGNNFVTWIWAESPSAEDLIHGLREGRAFLGDPVRFQGVFEISTSEGHAMGSVVLTDDSTAAIQLRTSGLPSDAQIRWIVDGKEVKRSTPTFAEHHEELRIDADAYHFVRAEAWIENRGLAFTNCIYVMPRRENSAPTRPSRSALPQ